MANESLSYRDAGVDIDAGEALVERIKPAVRKTHRPELRGGLGGFGALFRVPVDRYQAPLLVSGTDGVGTKLRLAIDHDRLDGLGQDLVAMCVNDILVSGAEPLFFLDYYATGKLSVEAAARVITGIAQACQDCNMSLAGGETAEMPGMYQSGDFDLAGFAVGVVEESALLDGSAVAPGDKLLGLTASGPHSNGFSLIRKILADHQAPLTQTLDDGQVLLDALLAPTRLYVQSCRAAIEQGGIHALAHITGGGLTENLPRVLSAGQMAVIDPNAWQLPAVFQWLQQTGHVTQAEMLRTFNCGIGMIAVVAQAQVDAVRACLQAHGETVIELGCVRAADDPQTAAHVVYQ